MKKILLNLGWAIVELIVFIVLFVLAFAIQLGILQLCRLQPLRYITLGYISEQTNPFPLLFLNYLPMLIAFFVASLVTHTVLFKRPWSGLGYGYSSAYSQFGKGWLWSLLLIIPGFLLLLVFHQITLLPVSANWLFVLGFLLFFLVQSAGEEVLTRAWLIPMLEYRLGTLVALICSASLFAVLHIGNDNFTWLGFINILLGGCIMAISFVVYRSIWICTGFHAGWNFIQAGFLDFNVSGLDVHSFIQFQDFGYPRITGGAFGYEGSLLAVVFQGFLLFYLLKNKTIGLKKPVYTILEKYPQPVLTAETTGPVSVADRKPDSEMDEKISL